MTFCVWAYRLCGCSHTPSAQSKEVGGFSWTQMSLARIVERVLTCLHSQSPQFPNTTILFVCVSFQNQRRTSRRLRLSMMNCCKSVCLVTSIKHCGEEDCVSCSFIAEWYQRTMLLRYHRTISYIYAFLLYDIRYDIKNLWYHRSMISYLIS